VTIKQPYGGLSNGSITIDSTDIFGGAYDIDVSNLGANDYHNTYEYALVEKANAVSIDSPDFDSYLSGLWQTDTQFSGLGIGDYVLYIRDRQDTAFCFSYELKIEDGTVEIETTVILDETTKKPSITVTARNGGGKYEFIAIPLPDKNTLLNAGEIEQAIADYVAEAWTRMEDAVTSAKAGITRANTALDNFKNALSNAKAADSESKINWNGIDTAVTTAESIDISSGWDDIDTFITDSYASNPAVLPDSGQMMLLLSAAAGTTADYMAAMTSIESAVRSAILADTEKIIDWNGLEQTAAVLKAEDSTFTQARDEIEEVFENSITWKQAISGNTYTWHDYETGWYQIAVRDKEEPANMASKSVYGGVTDNGGTTPGKDDKKSQANTNITGRNISGYTVTTPAGAPAVFDDARELLTANQLISLIRKAVPPAPKLLRCFTGLFWRP